jgi:hypothetical protein
MSNDEPDPLPPYSVVAAKPAPPTVALPACSTKNAGSATISVPPA